LRKKKLLDVPASSGGDWLISATCTSSLIVMLDALFVAFFSFTVADVLELDPKINSKFKKGYDEFELEFLNRAFVEIDKIITIYYYFCFKIFVRNYEN
jgi:hypothetical protein